MFLKERYNKGSLSADLKQALSPHLLQPFSVGHFLTCVCLNW